MTISLNVSTNQKDSSLNALLLGQQNMQPSEFESRFEGELKNQQTPERQDVAAVDGVDPVCQQQQPAVPTPIVAVSPSAETATTTQSIDGIDESSKEVVDTDLASDASSGMFFDLISQSNALQHLQGRSPDQRAEIQRKLQIDMVAGDDSPVKALLSDLESDTLVQKALPQAELNTTQNHSFAAGQSVDEPAAQSPEKTGTPTTQSTTLNTDVLNTRHTNDIVESLHDTSDLRLDAKAYWQLRRGALNEQQPSEQTNVGIIDPRPISKGEPVLRINSSLVDGIASETRIEFSKESQLNSEQSKQGTNATASPTSVVAGATLNGLTKLLDPVDTGSSEKPGLIPIILPKMEQIQDVVSQDDLVPADVEAAVVDAESPMIQAPVQQLIEPSSVNSAGLHATIAQEQKNAIHHQLLNAVGPAAETVSNAVSNASHPELSGISHGRLTENMKTTTELPAQSTNSSEQKPTYAEFMQQSNQQQGEQQAQQQHKEQPAMQRQMEAAVVSTTQDSTASVRLSTSDGPQSTTATLATHALSAASASSSIAAHVNKLTETLKTADVTPQQLPLDMQQPNAAAKLAERVMYQVHQKIQSAEVQLHPEDLGSMQIKVSLQQDQLSVQFVVQQGAAKEALEQQMPRLKDMLQQQGMQLADGQVEQRQSQQGEQRQSQNQRGTAAAADDSETGNLLQQGLVQVKVSDRAVDYYA